ncbi:MAG: MFS transporter [Flavobacteriales bacterium]|nr:MFS transporter [Flavobacteriales bacterium]
MKGITRSVWILSIISFFTDVSSEMLYPVMPVYLESIGFSILLIGILEGVAEAIAGLSKGYFGKLSDKSGRRVPFVQFGYLLSAISKPMLAFFTNVYWVLFMRSSERLGKGIRTGARDALLSDEANETTKGKIFGFHRTMDTLGAAAGPALALIYLYYFPGNYIQLFYLSIIPGSLSILTSLFLKESANTKTRKKPKVRFMDFWSYWKISPAYYKRVVLGLLMFTLFNSSDIFLLLMVKKAGFSDSYVIGVYIFYNLVYALFALPAGLIADKLGLKKVLIFGILLFAVVYFGMVFSRSIFLYAILFLLYGVYAASTEGISKAWISNLVPQEDTASALGTFAGFQSIFTMLASSLAGLIWYQFGAGVTFMLTSVAACLVAVYFATLPKIIQKSGS